MDVGLWISIGTALACCVVAWVYVNKANRAIEQSTELEIVEASQRDAMQRMEIQIQILEKNNDLILDDNSSLNQDVETQVRRRCECEHEIALLEGELRTVLKNSSEAIVHYEIQYEKLIDKYERLVEEYRDFQAVCKIHCPNILDRLVEYRRHG